jgi:hypothetical protein
MSAQASHLAHALGPLTMIDEDASCLSAPSILGSHAHTSRPGAGCVACVAHGRPRARGLVFGRIGGSSGRSLVVGPTVVIYSPRSLPPGMNPSQSTPRYRVSTAKPVGSSSSSLSSTSTGGGSAPSRPSSLRHSTIPASSSPLPAPPAAAVSSSSAFPPGMPPRMTLHHQQWPERHQQPGTNAVRMNGTAAPTMPRDKTITSGTRPSQPPSTSLWTRRPDMTDVTARSFGAPEHDRDTGSPSPGSAVSLSSSWEKTIYRTINRQIALLLSLYGCLSFLAYMTWSCLFFPNPILAIDTGVEEDPMSFIVLRGLLFTVLTSFTFVIFWKRSRYGRASLYDRAVLVVPNSSPTGSRSGCGPASCSPPTVHDGVLVRSIRDVEQERWRRTSVGTSLQYGLLSLISGLLLTGLLTWSTLPPVLFYPEG